MIFFYQKKTAMEAFDENKPLANFPLLEELCRSITSLSGRKALWKWVNEGIFEIVVEGAPDTDISIVGNEKLCAIVDERSHYVETLNDNEMTARRYLEIQGILATPDPPITIPI